MYTVLQLGSIGWHDHVFNSHPEHFRQVWTSSDMFRKYFQIMYNLCRVIMYVDRVTMHLIKVDMSNNTSDSTVGMIMRFLFIQDIVFSNSDCK